MKNLTTPQAILSGFVLVALAIASIPYSSNIVTPAHAAGVQKVALCDTSGLYCAKINLDRQLETHDGRANSFLFDIVKKNLWRN